MFKRKPKITPKTEFINFLETQIIYAQGNEQNSVIFPIETAEKVEWAKEFALQRDFKLEVSHQTDGLVYYSMRGWAV